MHSIIDELNNKLAGIQDHDICCARLDRANRFVIYQNVCGVEIIIFESYMNQLDNFGEAIILGTWTSYGKKIDLAVRKEVVKILRGYINCNIEEIN